MSTQSIKEALDWLENCLGHEPEAQDARRKARAEVDAIEKAARFITTVDTGATITQELAQQAVEASDTLERIAKESKDK